MDIKRHINNCKKGINHSQRLIFEHYTPKLHTVALRYARDRAEAKDILQEAWIKIFNGLQNYREEGKFEAYAARIVINCALRHQEKWRRQADSATYSFEQEPQQVAKGLAGMQYEDLLRLVNQLAEKPRLVFKLIEIDGLKHKEVGELLGIDASTCRAHLTRAKKHLRQMIEELENIEKKRFEHPELKKHG